MLERRKGPEAEPIEVTGRHVPSPTMTEEGRRGVGGGRKRGHQRQVWCGRSVLTGVADPRALRAGADRIHTDA
jgi:hypothetical protein